MNCLTSCISDDESASVNNTLKEYDDIKEIETLKPKKCKLFIKQCYLVVWSDKKKKDSKSPKVVKNKDARIMIKLCCFWKQNNKIYKIARS